MTTVIKYIQDVPKFWHALLVASALCVPAFGQVQRLTFFEVSGIGDKPLGKIRNITQDPRGEMWFSGEDAKCLYRYDGNQLTAYRQDFTDANSLGGVELTVVYADHEGMIWIGFGSGGMDRYDPVKNIFTHFRHAEDDNTSLSNGSVNSILKDRNETVWVATSAGLDRLDKGSPNFIHYRHDPDNSRSLSDNVVSGLYEDRQGVLWVATSGYPWADPTPTIGGLNRLESDGTFTQFTHDPSNANSLISNHVSAMFEDSHGTFWVGTAGDGLHTLDRSTGKFQRHTYDPAAADKLSRPPLVGDDWHRETDIITFFAEDHSGSIWIGALWGGLTRYDPVTQKITRYSKSNGYDDDSSWNGFVSRDGVLWISNQQARLFRTDPSTRMFHNAKVHPIGKNETVEVARILDNGDGTLWMGTSAGLVLADSSGTVLRQFPIRHEKNMLWVISMLPLESGTMMVGTNSGVYVMDTRTGQYHALDVGYPMELVIHIYRDKEGVIWITDTKSGFTRYERRSGAVKLYRSQPGDPESLSDNHTIRMQDDGDYLWVGTGENGISRLDKRTDKFKRYLPGGKSTYFYIDASGTLWAGTSNGLCRYDRKADAFLPVRLGTAASTDRTYGIAEDAQHNLWVTCPSAVVRIDSSRTLAGEFGVANGIVPGSITPGSICVRKDGHILFGSLDGYYQFNPKQFDVPAEAPSVMITGFFVNNQPASELLEQMNTRGAIELTHDQHNLSFSFALPDYRDPEGNRFHTMLERFDNEWRNASDNSSRYLSVEPGHYVYRVRAYTSLGSMSEKALAITLLPPWWRTWWAYAGYALIIAAMLFAARKIVVNQERLKANLMLEHVELEKAKDVDKVKNSFFANISHEFRTPLTLINGPVQELLESNHIDDKQRDQLHLIKRNADLLLKLINQILDLARVDAGTLKPDLREDDVYSFARAVVSSFESLARQKGVSLSMEIPITIRNAVFDRDKLETILINLVNNAIKFTPSGGSVHVTGKVESDQLILTVRDTGIGIAAEHQQKVFERFHQVSEAHKEVGTGIGLSLVKELVSFLHGRIELSSVLGEGTAFTVVLPLEKVAVPAVIADPVRKALMPAQEAHATATRRAPVAAADDPEENRYTILVVEDNSDIRSFIISAIGNEYHYLEAENGVQGLERAGAEIPNLIISDVMMPEMDGITMAKKLKKDLLTSHIPLILLTAKSTEDSKLLGLRSGADDYLTKPFNKHELTLKVRNAIARQDKLREKLRADLMSTAPPVAVLSDDEKFLERVKSIVLDRLSDPQLGVESLSEEIGLSRSQLFRKITALTGLSVVELIRKIRLQRAAQLIEKSWGPVAQVAYEVGFSNPSYFSKCFKDEFGKLPSEYVV